MVRIFKVLSGRKTFSSCKYLKILMLYGLLGNIDILLYAKAFGF